MYEFIASEIKEVSPNEAKALLQYNKYQGQRSVKKNHVSDLADRMKKGMFTTGSVCLASLNGDNELILMDGQHTLNAVIKSNMTIKILLERVRCNTPKDMALLYQQKDGGISRSLKDYVVAEKNALGIEWHPAVSSLVVSAISIINNSTHRTKSRKIELLEQYIPDGNFIIETLGQTRTRENAHLWRAPVVSIMILTYRSGRFNAEVFWEKVKTGEMLKTDDPQFVLRDFLMSHSSKAKLLRKPVASPHEFVYKCIYAWNAFLKGRKVKVIKYLPSYSIPEVL